MPTKIEWCDETINPVQDKIKGESGRGYHCTKTSPGCLNCYAETINNRFGNHLPFDGRKAEFRLIESELHKLAKWKKPRNIFVQSMGDLFHEDVPFDMIYKITQLTQTHTAYHTDHHAYLFLTKRPDNLAKYINYSQWNARPERNVYHGLTVCNQQEADEKIPIFLQVPGKKFLSIEPMLGGIDLTNYFWSTPDGKIQNQNRMGMPEHKLSAIILGGETLGNRPGREMKIEWVESIVDQCESAGVPLFVKQLHINGRVSKDINEWPKHLRKRSLPWA